MLQEPMLRQRISSERVVFVIPASGSSGAPTMRANRVIYLGLHTFCGDMTDAVQGWLKAVKWTEPFESHMAEIVRVHPRGIPGAIELAPMVAWYIGMPRSRERRVVQETLASPVRRPYWFHSRCGRFRVLA